MLAEIVLPETKPETEWVRGRPLQKVSPTYTHSQLQGLLCTACMQWAETSHTGRVGPEWRFRVAPPGEPLRPLVPDVGFMSFENLPADAPPELVEVPALAPTVAIEIVSPGDRRADVEHKTLTYLAAGTLAVIIVDPERRSIHVHDAHGVTRLGIGDRLVHAAMPGFELDIATLFRRAGLPPG